MDENVQSNGIDFDSLRESMVEHLMTKGGIRDQRVLDAMRRVPRHLFVDDSIRPRAYEDHALAISHEQTISQPYIVAKMIELLGVSPEDKILEVGMGSGYQTAILAQLAREVCTIERIPELAVAAEGILKQLGFQKIKIKIGDGSCGWPEEAPFSGIIVSAAASQIPDVLVEQLRSSGKLVIPIGSKESQRLIRLIKGEVGNRLEDHGGCVFVRLIGKHGWEA